MSDLIHYCDWSSQPDIHIMCDGTWSQPMWGPEGENPIGAEGVYKTDSGHLYTFTIEKVTCPTCVAKSFNPNSVKERVRRKMAEIRLGPHFAWMAGAGI